MTVVGERRLPAIVIVPGFNEPDKDMLTLSEGRRGLPGLRARGYECAVFPVYADDLADRIERYAEFLTGLRRAGVPFPVVSLGYSLGGLVVRGFLRRFPERAGDVAHTITLGTPHWGVTVDILPMLTAFLRLRDHAMRDLDIRSPFMAWLNGRRGHWEGRFPNRRWVLDGDPWVAPEGHCLHSIVGGVSRFGGDNDGIVWHDSATLGGRTSVHRIADPHANHLNLIGAFNLGTFLIKGFTFNDEIWQQAIDAIASHVEHHLVESTVSIS